MNSELFVVILQMCILLQVQRPYIIIAQLLDLLTKDYATKKSSYTKLHYKILK